MFSRSNLDSPLRRSLDPLLAETERLAWFNVYHGLEPSNVKPASQTELCLRNSVEKMLEKHSMVFGGMMVRLDIGRNSNFRQGFNEVADELFRDGVTWSKIVALFAFGARLGQHCRQTPGLEELVSEVAASLAEFTSQRLTPWVRDQGGWSMLCTVFPLEKDMETQLWRGLLVLGVSLTAATAFLAMRK